MISNSGDINLRDGRETRFYATQIFNRFLAEYG